MTPKTRLSMFEGIDVSTYASMFEGMYVLTNVSLLKSNDTK